MKVVLLIVLIVALAAVNAEVGGSSTALRAPSKALKRSRAVKANPVQVVGAAVKAAPASFDTKAAIQLLTTFAIWYGFNAACKCKNHTDL